MLLLDHARSSLVDDRGWDFDPAARTWLPGMSGRAATAVSPAEAVSWLQRESGYPCRVPIAVIGVARNAVIARAALALIAVGGGTGTLSEIAFGLQFGRRVFALEGAPAVDGTVGLAGWRALEEPLCRVVLGL